MTRCEGHVLQKSENMVQFFGGSSKSGKFFRYARLYTGGCITLTLANYAREDKNNRSDFAKLELFRLCKIRLTYIWLIYPFNNLPFSA